MTAGKKDQCPVCSPDQKWVYFVDRVARVISRVPLEEPGKTETVFRLPKDYVFWAQDLDISPEGRRFVVTLGHPNTGANQIALFETGSPAPQLIPVSLNYTGHLQFTPDGKSLAYTLSSLLSFVSESKDAENVWVQPLDGSTAHAITAFKSEHVYSFNLSPDGSTLAVLRGHWDSDVVLLQESK